MNFLPNCFAHRKSTLRPHFPGCIRHPGVQSHQSERIRATEVEVLESVDLCGERTLCALWLHDGVVRRLSREHILPCPRSLVALEPKWLRYSVVKHAKQLSTMYSLPRHFDASALTALLWSQQNKGALNSSLTCAVLAAHHRRQC